MQKSKIFIFICSISMIIMISNSVSAFSIREKRVDLAQDEIRINPKDHFFTGPEYNMFSEMIDLESISFKYSHQAKGIYLNAWSSGNINRVEEAIDLIKSSELNSVIIDLKDISGRITFMETDIIDTPRPNINDLEYLIKRFKQEDIYVIGRLVVFKDAALALKGPEYSLTYQLNNSDILINSSKWTNPYEKKVWEYNLAIAKEAVKLGINEIKFDYIRFPTLATNSKLSISGGAMDERSDIIVEFLKYANNELGNNVFISTDVYGLTTTIAGDLGIGQDITKMIHHVDYISPMIYPSHYGAGMYGIDNPNAEPYKVIKRSLEDAKDKLGENSYKLRPWLQDFNMGGIYTEKEIRDQIRAVEELGIKGWMFWNPSSRYTNEAF